MATPLPRAPISGQRPPDAHPRIALVLGAGGATGAAFHAGTLLALEQDLGWDPRAADVIVGSSAGSIVGSLLRAGLSTDDLAAWGSSVAAGVHGARSRRLLDEIESARMRLALPRLRDLVPTRGLVGRLRHPSQVRLHTAALSLLPFGAIDAAAGLERIGELIDGWPSDPLWIAAVRTGDGRRVVFGRDGLDAPLGRAVAASCAVPGLFRPVEIEGARYIDGGAHSPTNADVLVDAPVDAAIILSPMSGRRAATRGRHDRVLRSLFSRRLDRERAQLESAGIEVHVFEPDESTLEVSGLNALARRRTGDVARAAFFAAGDRLRHETALGELLRAHQPTSVPTGTPALEAQRA